jgi:cysteinyl-tRNA synthetase
MPLVLFNTLSRAEEEFRPLDSAGKEVTFYCCGPTVYNYAHIGNFRTFVFQDLLRRHLESHHFNVRHVMNITDVEDKIIRTVRETGEALPALTRRFENAFLEDLDALGCLRPKVLPRATEHVIEIVDFIKKLEEQGIAYRTSDGSVYFSLEKFPSYGKLSRLDRSQLKPGARVSQDEHVREAYGDFALWKSYDKQDGDVSWESPWGRGRPGWHIECSCMSIKHLGMTLDIHCGGEDLIFPHHEDEIAQSEALTGKPFVRFWLHAAHLLVNGQKMSKSAGNFYTIRDLVQKGYSGREIRYVLLSAHYRLPVNFTLEGLDAARQTLGRLEAWVERLTTLSKNAVAKEKPGKLFQVFQKSLDQDLNISEALGQLFEAVRESNRAMDENKLAESEASEILNDWRAIEQVLGLPKSKTEQIPEEVIALAKERDDARKNRDWKRSDELRNTLKEKGWIVKDSAQGFKLSKN